MAFTEKPPKSVRGSLISVRVDYAVYAGLDWMDVLRNLSQETKEDLSKLITGNYTVEEYFATPAHLKRIISGVGWYPASLYNGLSQAIMDLQKMKNNIPFEETTRLMGRYSAEQHLTGFTSYILKVASIAQVINLVVRGWQGYYSEGEIKVTRNEPGHAEMIAELSYVIPMLRFAMAGYFEVTLEYKKARDVRVVANLEKDHHNRFHFDMTWRT